MKNLNLLLVISITIVVSILTTIFTIEFYSQEKQDQLIKVPIIKVNHNKLRNHFNEFIYCEGEKKQIDLKQFISVENGHGGEIILNGNSIENKMLSTLQVGLFLFSKS
jgi:hypothetical protein